MKIPKTMKSMNVSFTALLVLALGGRLVAGSQLEESRSLRGPSAPSNIGGATAPAESERKLVSCKKSCNTLRNKKKKIECQKNCAVKLPSSPTPSQNQGIKVALQETKNALKAAKAELTTCDDALLTTEMELGTTKDELLKCNTDLSSTEFDLDTANDELAVCENSIATTGTATNAALATCEAALVTVRSELQTTTSSLASTEVDLGSVQTELQATAATLISTEAELAACSSTIPPPLTRSTYVGKGSCLSEENAHGVGYRYDSCMHRATIKAECEVQALRVPNAVGWTLIESTQACFVWVTGGDNCPKDFLFQDTSRFGPAPGTGYPYGSSEHTSDDCYSLEPSQDIIDRLKSEAVRLAGEVKASQSQLDSCQDPITYVGVGQCKDSRGSYYSRCQNKNIATEEECKAAAVRRPGTLGYNFVPCPSGGCLGGSDGCNIHVAHEQVSCPRGWEMILRSDWNGFGYPTGSSGVGNTKCYSFAPRTYSVFD